MNIFSRAAGGFALTPQERAFLRLVEGLLGVGAVAAIGVLANLAATGALALNQTTLDAVCGAAFVAIGLAVKKLVSAQGDAPYAPPQAPDRTTPLHMQDATQSGSTALTTGAETPPAY